MNSRVFSFLLLLLIITGPGSVYSLETAYGDPIEREDYTISRSIVVRELAKNEIIEDTITIYNERASPIAAGFSISDGLGEIISFESSGILISPGNFTEAEFLIIGQEIKDYLGEIKITGDITEEIPVNISVINETENQAFFVDLIPVKKSFSLKEQIEIKMDVKKILHNDIRNVSFSFFFKEINSDERLEISSETRDLTGSFQIKKTFNIPQGTPQGEYVIELITSYNDRETISRATFALRIPFFSIELFGLIPLWLLFLILGLILLSILAYFVIKKQIEKRKKYKMRLFTKTLPKKGERTLWLGKVAEKNITAYLEMDKLTTHAVVAGATGGGKSISAQVLIEEALMKNISVIVFDPTAQWSGMLRKCEDKKMLSFYPKFGLKPGDARAFPGNVRQIKNARQVIDITKHMVPGHINIFTLNKLDPSEMDIFVGSIIAQIFRSDPKEHPGLKTIIVFDEVHRLLPKFGGSGEGFLQIERACREFRKWGLGVMLVSQVLSDFVGEIKANINTEVQMRTRDESDLNRLKTKYGEEVLQSLIKASVGVGMFINSSYNKGKPYFVNFRPILHNTRRLSDEILDKYNSYGDAVDDLEYQIEQLEEEKVDIFDLKMELKLVKDKLMTGNFTVVDIYLESLKPRVEKQWQTIGKKPKKKEITLIDTKDVKASLEAAKKERENWEKETKDKGGEKEPDDKKTEINEDKKEGSENKDEQNTKPEEKTADKEQEKPGQTGNQKNQENI